MRNSIWAAGILVLLGVALTFAPPLAAAGYVSEKPVCSKVAVNSDGTKTLTAIFDESEGTGKGYDLLYADSNLNGKIEKSEVLKPKIQTCARGVHLTYPAIKLPLDGQPTGSSLGVVFNYQRHTYASSPSITSRVLKQASNVRTVENFSVVSTVTLGRGSDQWQFSTMSPITPTPDFKSATVCPAMQAPKLDIATRPDAQNEGRMGIQLSLMSGDAKIQGGKGSNPLSAHVEIKKSDGSVLHRDDASIDKFVFG